MQIDSFAAAQEVKKLRWIFRNLEKYLGTFEKAVIFWRVI